MKTAHKTFKSTVILALVYGLLVDQSAYGQALVQTLTGPSKSYENLSDADKRLSENFVHEGLAQRQYLEACGESDELKKACQGIDVDPKFAGMRSSMLQAIAKAYTMVIGAGAGGNLKMASPEEAAKADATGGGEVTKAPSTGKSNTDPNKDKQNDTDYCKYIAVGTETIAMVQQQVSQENINSIPVNQETAQKELLYRAARSHGERSQQSKVQFTGWGATTVCYGAMMMRPAVSKSAWQNWLKLGAAGVLTAFYQKLSSEHEKYEKKVKEIADALPGQGDCNPVTQKNCYCAQPETKFDPTHCAAEIHKRQIAENSYRVTCLDEKLKSDPSCQCAESNSCYDRVLDTQIDALGLNNYIKSGLSPFTSMAKGELKGGTLSAGTAGQNALSRRALSQSEPHLPKSSVSLNEAQKQDAKDFESMGLPRSLAAQLSSLPMTDEALKNVARFESQPVDGQSFANYRPTPTGSKNQVLNYSGGTNSNTGRRPASAAASNPFNKFQKNQGGAGKNGEVINYGYAEKAQRTAEINKADNRLIFEIISRRYQVSGWKRLDIE